MTDADEAASHGDLGSVSELQRVGRYRRKAVLPVHSTNKFVPWRADNGLERLHPESGEHDRYRGANALAQPFGSAIRGQRADEALTREGANGKQDRFRHLERPPPSDGDFGLLREEGHPPELRIHNEEASIGHRA